MTARILTALGAIPIVLGAVFCSHPAPFAFLALLVFCLGAKECFSLQGEPDFSLVVYSALIFVALCAGWLLFPVGVAGFGVLFAALLGASLSIFARLMRPQGQADSALNSFETKDQDPRSKMSAGLGTQCSGSFREPKTREPVSNNSPGLSTQQLRPKTPRLVLLSEVFGWIGAPIIALLVLHSTNGPTVWDFKSPVLMVFLPLWAGDTAGIFAGMALGRHKLAPAISPKKTIEGGIGNLVASVTVAWLLGRVLGFSALVSISCGVLAGVLGQIGDLFESWLKRRVGQKDSGTLLPGHGGVLDRIDSLLFAAIPSALLLVLAVGSGPRR